MKIINKMMWLIVAIITIALLAGGFLFWRLYQISQYINLDVPAVMKDLEVNYQLDQLADSIHYYDEVLTQSARNYAFTGDVKWENRYNDHVKNLDMVIREAQTVGGDVEKHFFSTVDEANTALVKMEENSMASVDAGDKATAIKILESQEYWDQKKVYQDGLDEYLNFRGGSIQKTFASSIGLLSGPIGVIRSRINSDLIFLVVMSLGGMMFSLFFGWLFAWIISRSIIKLKIASERIANGQLDEQVLINTNDEVGELGRAFNQMTQNLRESHESIEQKVAQRTAELEKLNKFMVGREIKMAELKKEIAQLKQK